MISYSKLTKIRRYPAETMTDSDDAYYFVLLANTLA